jgi:hypothetical protein
VKAFWPPQGVDSGAYCPADFEQAGIGDPVVWGVEKPVKISSLDPAFTSGGDKPACIFWEFGRDVLGVQVARVAEIIAVPFDATHTQVPPSFQVVRNWRKECEKRAVSPENACFESSGSPTFADVVKREWSPRVKAINNMGKPSNRPVGHEKGPDGRKVLCSERFENKATEIWFGAHPFLAAGQIRGVDVKLVGEICLRRLDKDGAGKRKKIESKRVFRSREGHSPDDADAFFIGLEHLRAAHGFKPAEVVNAPRGKPFPRKDAASVFQAPAAAPQTPWEVFRARARKIGPRSGGMQRNRTTQLPSNLRR